MLELDEKAARLETLLAQKCGASSGDLSKRARKAGRYLSKTVQAQIATITDAQQMAGHPKLARLIDAQAIDQAYADAVAGIKAVDRADLRRGFWLGIAGSMVFNLLLLLVIVLLIFWARGFLG